MSPELAGTNELKERIGEARRRIAATIRNGSAASPGHGPHIGLPHIGHKPTDKGIVTRLGSARDALSGKHLEPVALGRLPRRMLLAVRTRVSLRHVLVLLQTIVLGRIVRSRLRSRRRATMPPPLSLTSPRSWWVRARSTSDRAFASIQKARHRR